MGDKWYTNLFISGAYITSCIGSSWLGFFLESKQVWSTNWLMIRQVWLHFQSWDEPRLNHLILDGETSTSCQLIKRLMWAKPQSDRARLLSSSTDPLLMSHLVDQISLTSHSLTCLAAELKALTKWQSPGRELNMEPATVCLSVLNNVWTLVDNVNEPFISL